MASSKPTIVVAHGAWHVPAHYEPMAKPLREAGFEVIIPKHQSVGPKSDPGFALQKDATAIAKVLRNVLSSGKDAILLMHSYGGIAGGEAVGMLYEDPPQASNAGRLVRLVFLAAHVIEKGTSFFGYRRIPGVEVSEVGLAHAHC